MISIKRSILGIATLLAVEGAHAQEVVALNTWFSATHGDHFTTSDPRWAGTPGEVRAVGGGSGYVFLRQEGYVYNPALPQPPGTVPLQSYFNGTVSDNFITSDPRWTDGSPSAGYTLVRLEGYVHPSFRAGSAALRSYFSPSRADNYASTDPRLPFVLGGDAGENTRSVEGGRYHHYRVEGFMLPSSEPAPAPRTVIWGLADMHTHLMSHLGFGKKLIHGVPDAFPDGSFGATDGVPDGSIIPAGTRECNESDTRAATIDQALGHDNATHGGRNLFSNRCGDYLRNIAIRALESANGAHSEHGADKSGWQAFAHWPRFDDITHQQMWVDWIRSAHSGGLRVMVTLAVHSSTVARLIQGDPPFDDRRVADLQILETLAFVRRHDDFMEVAVSSAHLRDIVRRNKLAVVLGVELDDIGNFLSRSESSLTRTAIGIEMSRLSSMGVRYFFPIHLTDNHFGGAAAYEPIFNVANRLQTGNWWNLECSSTVGQRLSLDEGTLFALRVFGLGTPPLPDCAPGQGHRNLKGLTPAGESALDVLMRMGMLIDIDHMSERATDQAIAQARSFPSGWGYPLVSGHNGPRGSGGGERSIRADQLESMRDLGGLLGLGWAGANAATFHTTLRSAHELMGLGRVAFGTDTNGFAKLAGPRPGTQVTGLWRTGTRVWDYRLDGVAQYGMLPEFVRDLSSIDRDAATPAERASVYAVYNAAESFARAWERAELAARSALPR